MAKEKDNVGVRHPDYDRAARQREIFGDVCVGTLRLREKRKQYLPKFPAESDDDYKFRCDTATAFNLTKKTIDVMTGLVFKEGVSLEEDVNPEIVALAENIDNSGTHLDVFARQVFEDAFSGFSLILVDSPMQGADSRETQISLGLRPYWIKYTADDVTNWQVRINPISKRKELSLIVLREITHEAAGEFLSVQVVRYRAFRFDGTTVSWSLYREEEKQNGETEYLLEAEGILPNLSQIPVAIVGDLGRPPVLMDIALKNLEHFQTYSDYKSLIHKTCVPIPVAKGMQLGQDEEREMQVNGSTLIEMSADGDFGFAEVAGTSLEAIRQTLVDNREDISLMGLSLLADRDARVSQTATEVLLNSIGETADLRVMARSLQDALELALGHTAEYLNLERAAGGSVELGTAWSMQKDEFAVDLDELDKKAAIAIKLVGILPLQYILKMIGVENKEEIEEILRMIKDENAVVLQSIDEAERAMDDAI